MAALICILLLAAAAAAAIWLCLGYLRRPDRGPRRDVPLALAGAMALFWLLRTGIERRLLSPVDLFRFFVDGAALPVMGALLLLSVLAVLGLGLTAPGRRSLLRLRALARKNGFLWLYALAGAAVFFLWASRITVLRFMTNDDAYLLKVIARTRLYGVGEAQGAFSTVLFCWLLSRLYGIDPEGWWYAGYHLAVLFSACVITGRCLQLKVRDRGWHPLWGLLIQLLVSAAVLFPALARISFTVTPAAAGTAACALVLCREDAPTAGGRIASDAGAIALTLLSYLQRRAIGRALFCFLALCCAIRLIALLTGRRPDRKQRLWGLAAALAAGVLLLFGCRGLNVAMTETAAGGSQAEYLDAEYYRTVVMDYLGPQLTTEQLEAVGLPPELSNLMILQWYFMDERVNTDTFRRITELYYHPSETAEDSGGLLDRLRASYADSDSYLPIIYALTAAGALLALMALWLLLRHGRWALLPAFGCLAALGGGAILCLYLMLEGRFMFRAFLAVAMPALTVGLLCCLSLPAEAAPRREKPPVVPLLLGAGLAAMCAVVLLHIPYARTYADRDTLFASQWETEAYAAAHADTTFVTNSFSQNLDPFHGGSYPSNIRRWGGTGVTALADGDRMFASTFFEEDVRFLCETPGTVMLLLQYLSLDHGPVAALEEARLAGDLTVFDIDRIAPAAGADGWYERFGKTYYFREGEALAGAQTIDGEAFTFGLPGAASPMFLYPAEEGMWYSTMAYTLQPVS